jgi:tRNA-modifying protein YgfZ
MNIILSSRAVLAVSGEEAPEFLQGLLSNDVLKLAHGEVRYAALLTPQGKYAFDMFVWKTDDGFLLDIAAPRAGALLKTLSLYKLRRKVNLATRSDLSVEVDLSGTGDPRIAALGARRIVPARASGDETPYLERRLQHGVLEGEEIPLERAFILDYGFGELHGVDFNKGCYVGQEITARMHFKSIAKKGLYVVRGSAPLPPADTPVLAGGEPIGEMRAVLGTLGVALLKHEAVNAALSTDGVTLSATRPNYSA